jgi:hypothetical protein
MAKARDRRRTLDGFAEINHDAAGIDVGNAQHWVAVPAGRDAESVRMFGCFTADLHPLANWLERCGIKTVAVVFLYLWNDFVDRTRFTLFLKV